MTTKPISPALHGLIDYGFSAVNLTLPAALGLTGSARIVPAGWAVAQGLLNAFTNQPYAVKRSIPFSAHGHAESVGLPALFVTTALSGAVKQPRARVFFGALFVALVTNYILTDYDAGAEA